MLPHTTSLPAEAIEEGKKTELCWKDQSKEKTKKTPKMHQGLPKLKQQTREDGPHLAAPPWAVVSTDWVDFSLASVSVLQRLAPTNAGKQHKISLPGRWLSLKPGDESRLFPDDGEGR